ncbi:MAG: hypothetical protein LBH92_07450 [Bacteroidales bacterium]|nr:hypothetical protein [Bacteroidales bacterium]
MKQAMTVRISVSWRIFAVSIMITVTLTLLATAMQAVKAATDDSGHSISHSK